MRDPLWEKTHVAHFFRKGCALEALVAFLSTLFGCPFYTSFLPLTSAWAKMCMFARFCGVRVTKMMPRADGMDRRRARDPGGHGATASHGVAATHAAAGTHAVKSWDGHGLQYRVSPWGFQNSWCRRSSTGFRGAAGRRSPLWHGVTPETVAHHKAIATHGTLATHGAAATLRAHQPKEPPATMGYNAGGRRNPYAAR